MTPERWEQLKPLLAAAIGVPAEQRTPAYLDGLCRHDPALVAELRERLTKSREQIDQLTSDIMKTGNAPADAGVKLAIAAHHIESAQQLLRLLESNRSRNG